MAKLSKSELEMLGLNEESNNNVVENRTSTYEDVPTVQTVRREPIVATVAHPEAQYEEKRNELKDAWLNKFVVATIRGKKVYGLVDNAYATPFGAMLGVIYADGDMWGGSLVDEKNVTEAFGGDAVRAQAAAMYYLLMECRSLSAHIERNVAMNLPTTREEYLLKRYREMREKISAMAN